MLGEIPPSSPKRGDESPASAANLERAEYIDEKGGIEAYSQNLRQD
jgi:hypothetical protein